MCSQLRNLFPQSAAFHIYPKLSILNLSAFLSIYILQSSIHKPAFLECSGLHHLPVFVSRLSILRKTGKTFPHFSVPEDSVTEHGSVFLKYLIPAAFQR